MLLEVYELMRHCQPEQMITFHLRHPDYSRKLRRSLKDELTEKMCEEMWKLSIEVLEMQLFLRNHADRAAAAAAVLAGSVSDNGVSNGGSTELAHEAEEVDNGADNRADNANSGENSGAQTTRARRQTLWRMAMGSAAPQSRSLSAAVSPMRLVKGLEDVRRVMVAATRAAEPKEAASMAEAAGATAGVEEAGLAQIESERAEAAEEEEATLIPVQFDAKNLLNSKHPKGSRSSPPGRSSPPVLSSPPDRASLPGRSSPPVLLSSLSKDAQARRSSPPGRSSPPVRSSPPKEAQARVAAGEMAHARAVAQETARALAVATAAEAETAAAEAAAAEAAEAEAEAAKVAAAEAEAAEAEAAEAAAAEAARAAKRKEAADFLWKRAQAKQKAARALVEQEEVRARVEQEATRARAQEQAEREAHLRGVREKARVCAEEQAAARLEQEAARARAQKQAEREAHLGGLREKARVCAEEQARARSGTARVMAEILPPAQARAKAQARANNTAHFRANDTWAMAERDLEEELKAAAERAVAVGATLTPVTLQSYRTATLQAEPPQLHPKWYELQPPKVFLPSASLAVPGSADTATGQLLASPASLEGGLCESAFASPPTLGSSYARLALQASYTPLDGASPARTRLPARPSTAPAGRVVVMQGSPSRGGAENLQLATGLQSLSGFLDTIEADLDVREQEAILEERVLTVSTSVTTLSMMPPPTGSGPSQRRQRSRPWLEAPPHEHNARNSLQSRSVPAFVQTRLPRRRELFSRSPYGTDWRVSAKLRPEPPRFSPGWRMAPSAPSHTTEVRVAPKLLLPD